MECLQLLKTIPAGIEVWLLELNSVAMQLSDDWALLSANERVRAQRFRQRQDRARFVATRAALRRLLAERVMTPPDALRIETDCFGKPRLQMHAGIHFNISHAGGFALIALSTFGEIGIDIEQRHRDVTGLDVHVLSAVERTWGFWSGNHFIELWAVKEAILKALGLGIAEYLQAITVLPNGDGSYSITHDRPEWANISAWSIDAPMHYAAALALTHQYGLQAQSETSRSDDLQSA
ncbi:MAG: 4'-phosphopantetheinyl transferase superfamily protein [Nitrosomonas sp.]|nr:4'-phosphopantetheinyl transferase superfamily protein [Nitrosomonas sp.]